MNPSESIKESKRKPYNNRAGYIASLRSGLNHGWVVIYDAVSQGMDVDGRYAIVCETHSTLIGATSLKQARQVMKDPNFFCEGCEKKTTDI